MEQVESNSDEIIGSSELEYSIEILRCKTVDLMSSLLNPIKCISTGSGLDRYWKGLAELCNIESHYIQNICTRQNPTTEFIKLWKSRKDGSSLRNLFQHLERIERFDVIDDITPLVVDDIQHFKKFPNGFKIQEDISDTDTETDKDVLTSDDLNNIKNGMGPQRYDAFVLFADDDIDFAIKVIEEMEKKDLKFCVKERDLVGGSSNYGTITKLISERCNRLIVIVSPAFLESNANKFFLSFARAISIEQQQRKIIPCVYRKLVDIPSELRGLYMLDYTRAGRLFNFWEKLYDSIRTVKRPIVESPRIIVTNGDAVPKPEQPQQSIQKTDTNTLKPINHCVKFSLSLGALDKTETDTILPEENLIPSTSTNSLSAYPEEKKTMIKSKTNWIKKLFPKKLEKLTNGETNKQTDKNGKKMKKKKKEALEAS